MKVISIRQPWASLIVNGYKEYEFRSWKTNFRGPIYIHASKSIEKEHQERFKHLNLEYPVGKIIGQASIIHCHKVEPDFEQQLIRQNELIYGASRNRTGYAFQLTNITKIEPPIEAKGQLGLWNYDHELIKSEKQ